MVITIKMPKEASAAQLKGKRKCRFLFPRELSFLCWLSQAIEGDILEIGCNFGLTTAQLAMCNPGKLIHAVDFTGSNTTMCREQMREKPAGSKDIGKFAADLPNVRIYDVNSRTLEYDRITSPEQGGRPLAFVFIDGDHSYSGVKIDSALALAYFAHHDGIVVWHDYAVKNPHWVKVTDFIDSEIAPKYAVIHIAETRLALLAVGAKSQKIFKRLIRAHARRCSPGEN